MITPYPPPVGPRVELLRVRRDQTPPAAHLGPAPDATEAAPAASTTCARTDLRTADSALPTNTHQTSNP